MELGSNTISNLQLEPRLIISTCCRIAAMKIGARPAQAILNTNRSHSFRVGHLVLVYMPENDAKSRLVAAADASHTCLHRSTRILHHFIHDQNCTWCRDGNLKVMQSRVRQTLVREITFQFTSRTLKYDLRYLSYMDLCWDPLHPNHRRVD